MRLNALYAGSVDTLIGVRISMNFDFSWTLFCEVFVNLIFSLTLTYLKNDFTNDQMIYLLQMTGCLSQYF